MALCPLPVSLTRFGTSWLRGGMLDLLSVLVSTEMRYKDHDSPGYPTFILFLTCPTFCASGAQFVQLSVAK